MIGIEIDAAAERDVEILERDREPMRALEAGQTLGIGGGARVEPDAREIGVDLYLQAPISLLETFAVMFMPPLSPSTMCETAV